MTVTYIYHSGFLVELPHVTLLFDYYTGEIPPIRKDIPLYIFASHSHGDHFNRKIFKLAREAAAVRYYLSSDITKASVPENMLNQTTFLGADEQMEISDPAPVRIRTLRSNDLGVAFIVETDGKKLYFAGDLNNWWWDGDDEDRHLEAAYHQELEKIRGEAFDAAFIPLDPRLLGYEKGIEDFLRYASAKTIFPMHFGHKHEIIETMLPDPRLVRIDRPGQRFEIS